MMNEEISETTVPTTKIGETSPLMSTNEKQNEKIGITN